MFAFTLLTILALSALPEAMSSLQSLLLGGPPTNAPRNSLGLGVNIASSPSNFSTTGALLEQYQVLSGVYNALKDLRFAERRTTATLSALRTIIVGPRPHRSNKHRMELLFSANTICTAMGESRQTFRAFSGMLSEVRTTVMLVTDDAVAVSEETLGQAFEHRVFSPKFQAPYKFYHNAVLYLYAAAIELLDLSMNMGDSLSIIDERISAMKPLLSDEQIEQARSKRGLTVFGRTIIYRPNSPEMVGILRMLFCTRAVLEELEQEVLAMKEIVLSVRSDVSTMLGGSDVLLADATESLYNGVDHPHSDVIYALRNGSVTLENAIPIDPMFIFS